GQGEVTGGREGEGRLRAGALAGAGAGSTPGEGRRAPARQRARARALRRLPGVEARRRAEGAHVRGRHEDLDDEIVVADLDLDRIGLAREGLAPTHDSGGEDVDAGLEPGEAGLAVGAYRPRRLGRAIGGQGACAPGGELSAAPAKGHRDAALPARPGGPAS